MRPSDSLEAAVRERNCSRLDISSHPDRLRVMKKAFPPVRACFAQNSGVLLTREGPVSYQTGDAIVTGSDGEQWPVARSRFMASYEALPPDMTGGNDLYAKRSLPVWALRMDVPFYVTNEGGTLHGKAGDWLVQYDGADHGIVDAAIFAKTYTVLQKNP